LAALRDGIGVRLIGMREALAEMPEVQADATVERRLRNGDSRALDGIVPAGATLFKVVSDGRLLAVARADSRVSARLERVFGGGGG